MDGRARQQLFQLYRIDWHAIGHYMPSSHGSNICDPLLSRILLQTHFNISIKEYSHLHVPDHHQLDSGIKCSLEMQDGSHDGCLLDSLYNDQGIYYKYTWSSIRCFTFISRDRRRRDTSNGCALSMCVCQHRQLCGFNSVDDASLITGKDDSLTCHLGQGLLERLDGRDLTLVVVYNTVAKSTHGTRLKPTHTYTSFSWYWRPRTTHGPGITRASWGADKPEALTGKGAKRREIDVCERMKDVGMHKYSSVRLPPLHLRRLWRKVCRAIQEDLDDCLSLPRW